MKLLALFLLMSLANFACGDPRKLMAIDHHHAQKSSENQLQEQRIDVSDEATNHHNIPRGDWGSDGGNLNG